jgi:hypothetical protein
MKKPWGRKYRTELLVGATALLTPLAVDAAGVLMPSTAPALPASSTTTSGYRAQSWDSRPAPRGMLAGMTEDIQYRGVTQNIEFGARPRRQH